MTHVTSRLKDIDKAKGLAIVLVVFGHIVARQPPQFNEWYVFCKQFVYCFHMAFFMFLSGLVFFMKLTPQNNFVDIFSHVKRRFFRLMPAYILFASLVFLGKFLGKNFMYVDNPVTELSDFIDIFLFPMQSVATFLWYLYTLFLFSVVGLLLFSYFHGRFAPLLVISLALLISPRVDFMGLGQFSKYFIFFTLGGVAIKNWPTYIDFVCFSWKFAISLFFIFFIFFFIFNESALWVDSRGSFLWLVPAFLSIPAIHGLLRETKFLESTLVYFGEFSFSIYLMNTMTIGISKALLLKLVGWDGLNFIFLYLPVLMLSGLLLPIVVKKVIFSRFRWLDSITS
jgi:fucose 4-O-acetylase-like acetyltransferase